MDRYILTLLNFRFGPAPGMGTLGRVMHLHNTYTLSLSMDGLHQYFLISLPIIGGWKIIQFSSPRDGRLSIFPLNTFIFLGMGGMNGFQRTTSTKSLHMLGSHQADPGVWVGGQGTIPGVWGTNHPVGYPVPGQGQFPALVPGRFALPAATMAHISDILVAIPLTKLQ